MAQRKVKMHSSQLHVEISSTTFVDAIWEHTKRAQHNYIWWAYLHAAPLTVDKLLASTFACSSEK
jgi:exonuclease III